MEIVVDSGDGTRSWEITATRAGRRVEVETARGMVTVSEVTRSGQPVRSGRFLSTRVVALVEHPAGDGAAPTPRIAGATSRQRRTRRKETTGQATLL